MIGTVGTIVVAGALGAGLLANYGTGAGDDPPGGRLQTWAVQRHEHNRQMAALSPSQRDAVGAAVDAAPGLSVNPPAGNSDIITLFCAGSEAVGARTMRKTLLGAVPAEQRRSWATAYPVLVDHCPAIRDDHDATYSPRLKRELSSDSTTDTGGTW